jgi:hypothetical protein
MRETTTIRVTPSTRSALRSLADFDGVTLDEELTRLTRAERQRRFGAALASSEADDNEQRWLNMSAVTIWDERAGHASG